MKKAQAGAIVIVIIIILVIGAVIVVLIMANKKGYFTTPEPIVVNETMMSLIVQTTDMKSGESVEANYILYDLNHSVVSEGTIEKDELREIAIKPQVHEIVCWGEDYYLVRGFKELSQIDIDAGIATLTCSMSKIEKEPTIMHLGEIYQGKSQVTLNITVGNKLQRTALAIGYTSGFSDISVQEQFITCETGIWKNYTSINTTTQEPQWLPEEEFICADRIERCQVAIGNKCKSVKEKIPLRLRTTHDTAYYTGRSIENETITLTLLIETGEFINRFDEILITLYDYDRRYNPEEGRYTWFNELDSQDIGAPDKQIILRYEGEAP